MGRTFLSAHVDVFLPMKRHEEIPHRRSPLFLHVEVTRTPYRRFQLSHIPFLRVLNRKMTQQHRFFLIYMLAYTSVLRYLV